MSTQRRLFELLTALALSATACVQAEQADPRPAPAPRPDPVLVDAGRTAQLPPGGANLLENPGFEQGREPWTAMGGGVWGAFEVVEAPTRSGTKAAKLALRHESGAPGQPVKVYGVVQEPSPTEMPELLSGWFRVEDWWKEAPETSLYVQVVIIVWDDPKTEELTGVRNNPPLRNYQIRYYLGGIDEPPFVLSNAKYKFVAKALPKRGEWVPFELPLREDFQELWGHVPSGFSSLRVLFEARWDGKPEGAGVRADAYYDDLYLGPAAVR